MTLKTEQKRLAGIVKARIKLSEPAKVLEAKSGFVRAMLQLRGKTADALATHTCVRHDRGDSMDPELAERMPLESDMDRVVAQVPSAGSRRGQVGGRDSDHGVHPVHYGAGRSQESCGQGNKKAAEKKKNKDAIKAKTKNKSKPKQAPPVTALICYNWG